MAPEPGLRVAVLGLPSDHLFGGGLTLLSRLGPEITHRGGSMAWVDRFYGEDAVQLERWRRQGVRTIPVAPPRRFWQRWRDSARGDAAGCLAPLLSFAPTIVIVASGTDAPSDHDPWRLKRDLTAACSRRGAHTVMLHQLSEKGRRIKPTTDTDAWLQWQRGADWHQFVSAATWTETEANFGFELPGEVVRNCYNVPYHDPPPWPDTPELRFAFVGRFRIHQKGLDLVLEALARFQARRRSGWHFSMIGGGPGESWIKSFVQQHGLESNVTVEGHRDDLREFWRRHHVLVMPSRAEGLSLALCEAMLCERPALATLVGGTGDLLQDGVTGWVCGPSPEDLAAVMDTVMEEHRRGNLRGKGRAAGERARAVLPADPESAYVDTLEALLNRPGGSGRT